MNPRQTKFVAEYLKSRNATRAATAAGYSKKTADRIGSRLLKNVEIAKLLKAQQKEVLKEAKTSSGIVIKKIWKLYDTTRSEHVQLKCLELLGRHTGAWISVRDLIAELSQDELKLLIQKLQDDGT